MAVVAVVAALSSMPSTYPALRSSANSVSSHVAVVRYPKGRVALLLPASPHSYSLFAQCRRCDPSSSESGTEFSQATSTVAFALFRGELVVGELSRVGQSMPSRSSRANWQEEMQVEQRLSSLVLGPFQNATEMK